MIEQLIRSRNQYVRTITNNAQLNHSFTFLVSFQYIVQFADNLFYIHRTASMALYLMCCSTHTFDAQWLCTTYFLLSIFYACLFLLYYLQNAFTYFVMILWNFLCLYFDWQTRSDFALAFFGTLEFIRFKNA